MKKTYLWGLLLSFSLISATHASRIVGIASSSDLRFNKAAATWDEGIPLGNGVVGSLVWKHGGALRFSLDRVDLWDLRPVKQFDDQFTYQWVADHVRSKNYKPVVDRYDNFYEDLPGPSKIPGVALEFPLAVMGAPSSVHLFLRNALCEMKWPDGATLTTFVHATRPIGWFEFCNVPDSLLPQLLPPSYNKMSAAVQGEQAGADLSRLGYPQGKVSQSQGHILYHQPGWGGFSYDVSVRWQREGHTLRGVWSVTSSLSSSKAAVETSEALKRGMTKDFSAHSLFWEHFWAESSVQLPDTVLQKQYDSENYKFGAVSREDSYPISLQAVWTADNGKLPPWKGDYHHDLNTELSYWPAYIGNHLSEGMGYINTIWRQRDVYRQYTHQFFGTDGVNIPGVCTLTGKPLGGWIQYSFSPTMGAWVAQHLYLQWKYAADATFLKNCAYPMIKDVATHLEQLSYIDSTGHRNLSISSSPEIFDNSLKAWFTHITNFDLSLMMTTFDEASEMADVLRLPAEASHWRQVRNQLPALDTGADGSLTFAPGVPYVQSHRHFSHAMAIFPLGLIDRSQGPQAERIIRATLARLDSVGPAWWCGYSYSWLGNMKARAGDGEGAAKALRTFADCFCLPNTFHANGDQTRSGKSNFTYRPFTLEGNFAFASGVQQMLLQSHTGTIELFPAIPLSWRDVSFRTLRARGAFLVSASMEQGRIIEVEIVSEKGGQMNLSLKGRLSDYVVKGDNGKLMQKGDILHLDMHQGQKLTFTLK